MRTDPSVIGQDRADNTSPTSQGMTKTWGFVVSSTTS